MVEYLTYKESGIPWVGCIPNHWDVKRGKNVLILLDRPVIDGDEVITCFRDGEVTLRKNRREDGFTVSLQEIGYQGIEPGDLVVHGMDGFAGAIGVSDSRGKGTPVLNVMDSDHNKRFLMYYLRAAAYKDVFMSLSTGIRVRSCDLRWNKISVFPFVLPERNEQDLIVQFLDGTLAKVDATISEAKSSIEEYNQWKQAIIDEAILGYDDIHIKLRQLGTLKNGINFSHSEESPNIKFLGVGCFQNKMFLDGIEDFADEYIDFTVGDDYLLRNGDIVFVRSNGSKELVGRSVIVNNISFPVTFSGFCIRFRNLKQDLVDNLFLIYYFRTSHFKQTLLKYSNDSTNINNLNQEMLNAISIDAPYISEQMQITQSLKKKLDTIDSLILEKESLIIDLECYKKSLIYEVVTGKKRICK